MPGGAEPCSSYSRRLNMLHSAAGASQHVAWHRFALWLPASQMAPTALTPPVLGFYCHRDSATSSAFFSLQMSPGFCWIWAACGEHPASAPVPKPSCLNAQACPRFTARVPTGVLWQESWHLCHKRLSPGLDPRLNTAQAWASAPGS